MKVRQNERFVSNFSATCRKLFSHFRLIFKKVFCQIFQYAKWIVNECQYCSEFYNKKSRANVVSLNSYHITFGIDTTSSIARVSTFLLDTGLVRWTFSINHTFGSAIGWGSNVPGQARASLMSIQNLTHCISSTWWGLTRYWWSLSHRSFYNEYMGLTSEAMIDETKLTSSWIPF